MPFMVDTQMKLKQKQAELKVIKDQIDLLENYENSREEERRFPRVKPKPVAPRIREEEQYEEPTIKRQVIQKPQPQPQMSNPLQIPSRTRDEVYVDNLTRMILGRR